MINFKVTLKDTSKHNNAGTRTVTVRARDSYSASRIAERETGWEYVDITTREAN